MLKKSYLLLAGAVMLTACATPPRFEYGAYEPTLYAYYKKPETAEKFESALKKAIEKGESSDRLAPGLYSELGYLQLLQGDQAAAIDMFEKEAAAFPESRFFMGTIVRRLKGEEPAPVEAETAPQELSSEVVDDADLAAPPEPATSTGEQEAETNETAGDA